MNESDHDRPDRSEGRVARRRPPDQIHDSEHDEQSRHRELHREPHARGDRELEENDRAADEENRRGVPGSPERPDGRRSPDRARPRDDRGDRDDVVGVRRMTHAEEEAEREHGQKGDHRWVS